MAFRAKEAAASIGIMLAPFLHAAEVSTSALHDHLRGAGRGELIATDESLRFEESGEDADHKWTLAWDDIQQLWIGPAELRVVTYEDRKWRLGRDREHRLRAAPGSSFEPLYGALKDRLDQRLVAALSDAPATALWELPAKLRTRFGGPEGTLIAGVDRIVFRSPERGESRTWRMEDVESVSSSGAFDLTITTLERSFTFQLKRPLRPAQYESLWRRANDSKQLDFIRSIGEKQP